MAAKTYVCERWPFLMIRSVQFQDGRYTTEDEEEQTIIEDSEDYGIHIFLEGDAPKAPADPEDPEQPPKAPTMRGAARQGRTGTGAHGKED